MIIFDAIIRSKRLCGLETQALSKSLDTFQMRSLRKILQRPSSFADRRYTNQKILDEATSVAFPTRGDNRKITRFSEYHMNRRAKLLGHILRSSNDDPMRQVSFLPHSASRVDYGKNESENRGKTGCITRKGLSTSKFSDIIILTNIPMIIVCMQLPWVDRFKQAHLIP